MDLFRNSSSVKGATQGVENIGNIFNKLLENQELAVFFTAISCSVVIPGMLQDLFSKSKVFRFCYFFFFIYQILNKDLSKTFGATVIVLLIVDLLRKQDDVYEPTFINFNNILVKI